MEMDDIAISAEYICATFKICRLHFYHDKLLLYTHLYGISEVILHAESNEQNVIRFEYHIGAASMTSV